MVHDSVFISYGISEGNVVSDPRLDWAVGSGEQQEKW